jgi:mannosyl-glycoprotein endo-beta-N-acetylglucosaminidase
LKKIIYSFLPVTLFLIVFLIPSKSFAYTDTSIYNIETSGIVGEQNTQNALQKLRQDTGWWATYKPTGATVPYYQINSGGYYGEDNVKAIINQFQQTTGVNASYRPIGDPVPYKQVVSGGYYGEDYVKNIIQAFQNSTGFSATYQPTGAGIQKKRIISGGYIGEDNVKQVLQKFQAATGIPAKYESNGQYQEYYQLVSGGYYGEDNVKSILQNFVSQTGIPATYVPSAYIDTYTVLTGGFVGEAYTQTIVSQIKNDLGLVVKYVPGFQPNVFNIVFDPLSGDSLTKVTNYLDQKHWWYSKTNTGKPVPLYYNIVSDPSLDKGQLDKALGFFQQRNWWATVKPTGQKFYNVFQIVSDPITDELTSKGLNFFAQNGWWATSQSTNELYYQYYNIISEPLLEKEKVDKAVNFFKNNGWWVTSQDTNKTGYTLFWITSDPILGSDNAANALKFFTNHNWYAVSQPTGKSEGVYKIVVGGFQGYDATLGYANLITSTYGWQTTPVKVVNGPQVTYTNYNLTLNDMLNLEMGLSPQTEKYMNDPAYVFSAYIDPVNNIITANPTVNVRSGPGTNYSIVSKLNYGYSGFKIVGKVGNGDWTQISLRWKNAQPADVQYYLDPNNFPSDSKEYFQFLKLSSPAGINVDEVNTKILNANTGILNGRAAAFVQAAKQYNINEMYLISHALLETGNGSSALAKGVTYNGQVVYNMYGYGAFDSCPLQCGAKTAYDMGWFTPDQAIIGGAALIGSGYINNATFQQDTLYKMRWNPVNPYHQYATDIAWSAAQVNSIYNLYKLLDNYTLYMDIPVYK